MRFARRPCLLVVLFAGLLGPVASIRAQDLTPGFSDDVTPYQPEPAAEGAPPVRVVEPAPEACPPAVVPIGPAVVLPEESEFPFVPYMLGDFIGPLANPMTDMKASEGESPIPIDRVFYRFNAYANLDPNKYGSPYEPYSSVNLYTNVFGFEKTVFGGAMSVGLRLPINGIQATSRGTYLVRLPGGQVVSRPARPDYGSTQFGNITTLVKLRLIEDPTAAYLVSGGFALSFPTATTQRIDPGPSTASIFQPFTGFVYSRNRFFAQGFGSLTLPLVTVQSMLGFGDLGIGYWLVRPQGPGRFLTGFAPTFEMHLNVPLQSGERVGQLYDAVGLLPFSTQFNLTFGGTFEFAHKATLGLGFVLPTVDPLPFEYEFLAHFNYRF